MGNAALFLRRAAGRFAWTLFTVGQEGFHFLSRLLSAGGGRVFRLSDYSIVTLYRVADFRRDSRFLADLV